MGTADLADGENGLERSMMKIPVPVARESSSETISTVVDLRRGSGVSSVMTHLAVG